MVLQPHAVPPELPAAHWPARRPMLTYRMQLRAPTTAQKCWPLFSQTSSHLGWISFFFISCRIPCEADSHVSSPDSARVLPRIAPAGHGSLAPLLYPHPLSHSSLHTSDPTSVVKNSWDLFNGLLAFETLFSSIAVPAFLRVRPQPCEV